MEKRHPRSPNERLGGYVHLPRLIDKARLHRQGLLEGYNYKTVGFDKNLLAFLRVDPDAFEEAVHRLESDAEILEWIQNNGVTHTPEAIEQWSQAMIDRRPDTVEKMARFRYSLKKAGGEDRTDVCTYFDLIDLEEGRLNEACANCR